jgi:hypothetical protein
MAKPTCEVVLQTTLEAAKTIRVGDSFRASKVRDRLGLPAEQWHGHAIRECWRQNRAWLKKQGLELVEEPKSKLSWWYLRKMHSTSAEK